ncbi:long-chain fatty acid--CoA ligase [Actinosynnema sp. NPDC023587]|uniref:long-chain-fatty-acid--CoA ligase n=1 Tax=Actinosynnema sp. NPDC023587 TaxID=3154695 RepID=UPI0033D14A59
MTVSVAAILAESAGRRPEHPAIVSGAERVTYRELWRRARSCAAVLRAHDVGPGDRVALLLPNTPHFAAVYFGALALGAVPVPVNVLLRTAEIAYVLEDSGAVALATDPSLVGSAPRTVEVLCEELLAPAEPIDSYLPREPGDLALVLYTSGTTGRPKGAMLSHLNVVLNVGTTVRSPFDFGPDDVLLGALPLFHTFGQVCGMLTCFAASATMVLMPRFDGPEAIRLMIAHGCTVFMGVPTMYLALLDATASGRPKLDRVFSGGAALPVEVLEDVERTFGCRVYEGYGLTETSPVVAYNQKAWPSRPGTVGKPIWGVRVAIARPEVEGRIELLPAGEPGEVVISGHNVMLGYLNRPEATAEVLVDGWLRSGDVGVLDDEGYLRLVDRKKDVVVRGGYKVYPREVEQVLVGHPKIAQVAVIGVPHERHGEEVCAVVVPRSGAAPGAELAQELVTWGKERLAAYKYPRRVEFVTGFPLGSSGKVLKRELYRAVAALDESAASGRHHLPPHLSEQ